MAKFHLFKCLSHIALQTCHFFFSCSSGHRHFVCLRVLARVNGAAVPTWVHMSFRILVISAYTLRVPMANLMVALILSLKALPWCSLNWLLEFATQQHNKRVCTSLCPLHHLFIVDFWWWPSDRCKVTPRGELDLHVSANYYVEHVLMGCFYSYSTWVEFTCWKCFRWKSALFSLIVKHLSLDILWSQIPFRVQQSLGILSAQKHLFEVAFAGNVLKAQDFFWPNSP